MGSAPINRGVVRLLAGLIRTSGSAQVQVGGPDGRRAFEIVAGAIRGTQSSYLEDQVGAIAAHLGLVDPGLAEPVSQVARAAGRTTGEQLVFETLLTPAQVAEVIRVQELLRLARMLQMQGNAVQSPVPRGGSASGRDLGRTLLEVFRDRLELDAIEELLLSPPAPASTREERDAVVFRLGLTGAELRTYHRIARGESARAVLIQSGDDATARLLGALVAVGAIEWK